ncbi:MAG TPA: flagellar hook protein FlgE [Bryobacteraceae bacterium]|nr:flagellar hook protein FlgE [Bryobacteraceae bacterium]
MYTAFSTALSALNATSVGVDTVGNNLANLNTPGYKANTVSFYDMVAASMGVDSAANPTGIGVGRPLTVRQFTQGTVQTTSGRLDAAIQGDGFFIVRDGAGQTLYTRAGNFHVDAQGHLLTATGERVQGWQAVNGVLDPSAAVLGDLTLPSSAQFAPQATTQMSIDMNLNASAVTGQTGDTFSTPVQVFDSEGSTHVLTATFTKTDANTWDFQITIPGEDVTAGTAGTPYAIPGASGTLTFDAQGHLSDPPADSGTVPITIAGLTTGAADLNIDWSLYNADLTPRVTQYAEASTGESSQNGAATAHLTEVKLADGGTLLAHYSNGQDEAVGQLALATFRNPESMTAVGNNNLQVTYDTATAAVGPPNTAGRGQIMGGALESSTVDIAREFTNLIVMQRSYQANARVVTTADELSQETLNLKR